MMGGETPETCWATHKRQVINLWNCCILLVELFEKLLIPLNVKNLLNISNSCICLFRTGPGTINIRPVILRLIKFYTSIRKGLCCKQQMKRKACYQQLPNGKWILALSTAAQSSWKANRAVFSVGILSMRVLMCFLFSSWDFVTSSFFSSFFFFSSP